MDGLARGMFMRSITYFTVAFSMWCIEIFLSICVFYNLIILCLMIYLLITSCKIHNGTGGQFGTALPRLFFINHRDLKLTHSEKQNI